MADLVHTTTRISFKPIQVPRWVQIITGEDTRDGGGAVGIRVDSLDKTALDALAADWLEQLYLCGGQVNDWSLKNEKKSGANG